MRYEDARQALKVGSKHWDRYTREFVAFELGWLETCRPKQITPAGDWFEWLILSGRGWGKTRTGAQDLSRFAILHPRSRSVAVGATQNDVRSVIFEGESGFKNVLPPYFLQGGQWSKAYNSTDIELTLRNGSIIYGKSAERPDRLRGPQYHRAWCDELAHWQRLDDTWDNLMFGLRLGTDPRVIITTTPTPLDFLRKMSRSKSAFVTRGSTFENKRNLAGRALEKLREVYEGTRRGRQELYGEILEDVAGALWSQALLETTRYKQDEVPPMRRVVVAIDPAVTDEESSDETGIVVVGQGEDEHAYVLADFSGHYSPDQWAALALNAYERFEADAIVAEVNQGGDLVEANLRAQDRSRNFNFVTTRAKRGKYLRAEPISALYSKFKVHHVGLFPELEDQMCRFTGPKDGKSPDRLDALVYGVGELMLGAEKHAFW